MMTWLNRILGVVLLGQALLFGLLFALGGRDAGERPPERALFAGLAQKDVTRLTLEGEDGARLELAREGPGWVLPGQSGYPADGAKIERLLGQLLELRARLLVARGAGHQADLEVAPGRFRRKLTLRAGERSLELFVGGRRAGFTQVRLGQEVDTYGVDALDEWQLPTAPMDWLDKGGLAVPRERLVRLEVARGERVLRLARVGGEWRLGEERVPARKAEELVDQIARLEPVDVLGRLDDPAVRARVDQGREPAIIRLGLAAAPAGADGGAPDGQAAAEPVPVEERVLRVAAHPDKTTQALVYQEGARFAVVVDRWRLERLLDLDPVELLKPEPPPDPAAEPPIPGLDE
ncbi:MAG TPA: DUF4340 domain-containing protein [Myxococcota bacterium]|nr:DUF4340 domain-containing protein [Myxococcota bacterium]HRY92744.1 DUF4340 domain-containing protein [Myxococcota bacterium]HSA20714.1 DUF4340 domain-containing protein [Myxococcota bacterium]